MADCFTLRLDHLDFNPSGNIHHEGKPIPISSISKVLFTYDAYLNNTTVSQQGVFCRSFDTSARTLASAVAIDNTPTDIAAGTNSRFRFPSWVRLTDGTIVVLYRWDNGNITPRWYAKESTDNGATWTARVLVMDENLALTRAIDSAGLFTNGTAVWCNATGASTTHTFVYLTKRTGIGTWGAPVAVIDTTAPSNEAGTDNPWYFTRADHGVLSSDGTTAVMVGRKAYDSGTHIDIRVLWSIDSGSTWTQTVVASYSVLGPSSFNDYTIDLGTDNRLRIVALGADNQIYLSYSDDTGKTWSVPHVPSGSGAGWVRGVASGLDPSNVTFAATVGDGGGGGPAHYYSGTDLGAWSNIANCDIGSLDPTYVSYPGNDAGVFSGNDFYFVSNGISGGTFHTLQLLLRANLGTSPSTPPTFVPSATTAANVEPQTYLRQNEALERGWSVHDLDVPCFLGWNGGTYATAPNVPIVLRGNPALFEAFTGSAGALAFRVDDPNVYALLEFDDDATAPSYTPLPFVLWSRLFNLGGTDYGTGIARGFLIAMKRQTLPVLVQVYVDGVCVRTESLAAKGPMVAQYFIPIPPFDSAGTSFQLRIEDRENEPLEVHGIGFMSIQKGVRG